MKKLITSLSVVCGLLAASQAGQTDYSRQITEPVVETRIGVGPYVAVFGGANVHQDADIEDLDVLGVHIDTDLDPDTGWFAGLKLGYVFDTHTWFLPAIELEAFYNRLDVKVDATANALETDASAEAELKSGVFMLNLLGKIDLGRFRPYIGGGAGAVYLEAGDVRGKLRISGEEVLDFTADADEIGNVANLRTSGWDFAWQAIGGFDFYITDRLSVFAEYKALWFYSDADEIDHYLQHLVGGGVRFHF